MYKKVIWSNRKPKEQQPDTLYLSTKDINHIERIFSKYKLLPESFEEVRIEYIADRHKLIRYVIKELDILLMVGGKFVINSTYTQVHANFIRSLSQIKYEYSVSTNGRYILQSEKVSKYKSSLIYIKQRNTLVKEDSIDRWSFGIITNGKKNEQVENLIDSIISQNIPYYEIIICGNFKYENVDKFPIVAIDDVKIKEEIRAPITIKKNKIVKAANYQNMMILHDRYLLPSDWFEKMKNYGNYFDLLTMANIGPKGGRVIDWLEFRGKPSELLNRINYNLDYKKWSDNWYSQGGLLIIKKHLYEQNKLDERLFWGELEDLQFSQIGNLKGWFYYFDINNKIFTFSDRLSEMRPRLHFKILSDVKAIIKYPYVDYFKLKIKNMLRHYFNIHG